MEVLLLPLSASNISKCEKNEKYFLINFQNFLKLCSILLYCLIISLQYCNMHRHNDGKLLPHSAAGAIGYIRIDLRIPSLLCS